MGGMIVTIALTVVALLAIFGGLSIVCGDNEKGSSIMTECLSALVLYFFIITFYGIGLTGNGILSSSLPLISDIDKYGNLTSFFNAQPDIFALDFVELVILFILVNIISRFIHSSGGGIAGTIILKIIIIFMSCLIYGIFMDFVRENVYLKWTVYLVECVITGSAIVYTPTVIIAFILGFKPETYLVTYLLEELPKSSIGKSISSAISSATVFIFVIAALESQYGSIKNILSSTISIIPGFGTIIIMLMGIYFMINALKK